MQNQLHFIARTGMKYLLTNYLFMAAAMISTLQSSCQQNFATYQLMRITIHYYDKSFVVTPASRLLQTEWCQNLMTQL